jgi:hypothetical protein
LAEFFLTVVLTGKQIKMTGKEGNREASFPAEMFPGNLRHTLRC